MKYTRHLLPPPAGAPAKTQTHYKQNFLSFLLVYPLPLVVRPPLHRSFLSLSNERRSCSPSLVATKRSRRVRRKKGRGHSRHEQCYNLLYNLVRISRKYWRNLRSVLAKLTVKGVAMERRGQARGCAVSRLCHAKRESVQTRVPSPSSLTTLHYPCSFFLFV